jgi:ribonuclease HII
MDHLKVRFQEDSLLECGIDEAGRGCLWGPLYAAAVVWAPESEWMDEQKALAPMIQDSKKLSAKKRKRIAEEIKNYAIAYGIGSVSAAEIDKLGMTTANRLAFQRALEAMEFVPDRLLIDGILLLEKEYIQEKSIQAQETIIEGDALYLPIAAASILAKEARDTWVEGYIASTSDLDEKYSLQSSKGYGTLKHRNGILKHGTHAEHRNLFLRKLLGNKCLINDD